MAPLAAPILALGLGVIVGRARLIVRSAATLGVAALAAGVITALVAYLLPPFTINGTFISFVANPLYDLAIAFIAGAIAAYGHVRVKVGGSLTGIGIAVSLMPPLVAAALALGRMNFPLFNEALVIFLLNILGILCGSVVVFFLFGITAKHLPNK